MICIRCFRLSKCIFVGVNIEGLTKDDGVIRRFDLLGLYISLAVVGNKL